MKLSICLPVYNYSTGKLVKQLIDQADQAGVDYEILIYDDGSNEYFIKKNSKLATKYDKVLHYYNIHNFGRSFARNYLANKSSGTHLLFIDADSQLKNYDFIKKYIEYSNYSVVCGGTWYSETHPEQGKELRYYYGQKREKKTAEQRNKNPNRSFATNNFLIEKSIFEKVKFREFLKKYGHEDSLFGYELKINNYKIYHIDNPVIHIGIENNRIFLSKTIEGIKNLIEIEKNNQVPPDFLSDIRLVRMAKKFNIIKFLIIFLYKRYLRAIHNNLINSKKPKIILFDFYKLANYYILKREAYEKIKK